MKDPARGTLTLSGVSAAPNLGVRAQSFDFVGVVQAPGVPATAVELTGLLAPAGKWPQPGSTLPVTVDRADPHHVVIDWDEVPSNRDLAVAQADNAVFAAQSGIDINVLDQAIRDSDSHWPPSDPPISPSSS